MTTHHLRYLIPAAVIIAGVIFILCGMDLYRALYLIIFGVLVIPAGKTDLQNKETPKGVNFWLRKMLVNILSVMTTLSLCNFLIPNHTSELKHFVIWLCVCIICGILFGTFDYFAHNTGGDEAEFEAKKKHHQEIGEIYDKVVEEMNSEKK